MAAALLCGCALTPAVTGCAVATGGVKLVKDTVKIVPAVYSDATGLAHDLNSTNHSPSLTLKAVEKLGEDAVNYGPTVIDDVTGIFGGPKIGPVIAPPTPPVAANANTGAKDAPLWGNPSVATK
jgi:hypothetical protein